MIGGLDIVDITGVPRRYFTKLSMFYSNFMSYFIVTEEKKQERSLLVEIQYFMKFA